MSLLLDHVPPAPLTEPPLPQRPPLRQRLSIQPQRNLSPGARTGNLVLLVVLGIAIWLLLFAFVFSGFQEARSQRILYAKLRQGLAEATVPLSGPAEGDAVALLDAPSAGLHSAVVVQGTSSDDLRKGPGHLRSTVLPGQVGTSYLLARSHTYGGPFNDIASMHKGDVITVTDPVGTFTFHVIDVRRPGDRLPPALATGKGRLTLATGEASGNAFSLGIPSHVVYVDADLAGTAKAAGSVQTAAHDELALKPQTNSLGSLVLWLQGLVLCSGALVWARVRVGARQTWLLGTPILLALLWGVTSSASLLLPNLF